MTAGLRWLLGRRRAAIAFGLIVWAAAAAGSPDIFLSRIKGDVQLQAAGLAGYQTAQIGSPLRVGDRVRTGRDGWAYLSFADGSRVVLTSGSEFVIRRLDIERRAGLFFLIAGKLRAVVSHRPEGPADYSFSTRTAVAGLRGTDFSLIHHGEANVFFGNTGEVQVHGLSSNTQPLTADTVVQTTRGLDPVSPIALDPTSPLARARQVLNEATEAPPASWAEVDRLPEIVARWDINYSRYLADAGRDAEALEVLQVALDLTDDAVIKADAHLERAAIQGRTPEGAAAALNEYAQLLDPATPPPQRETALFMSGKAMQQLGRLQEAREHLTQYLREYPGGRFAASCETLLRLLEKSP